MKGVLITCLCKTRFIHPKIMTSNPCGGTNLDLLFIFLSTGPHKNQANGDTLIIKMQYFLLQFSDIYS